MKKPHKRRVGPAKDPAPEAVESQKVQPTDGSEYWSKEARSSAQPLNISSIRSEEVDKKQS